MFEFAMTKIVNLLFFLHLSFLHTQGDNLAEQWINFLIDESDQDASNSAGLVPRARSHSDAVSSSPKANAKMGADVDLSYK